MPRGRLPPLLVVVLLVATTQKSVRDASATTFQQFTSYGKAKTIVVAWQRPTSQYCTHTVVKPRTLVTHELKKTIMHVTHSTTQ